MVRGSTAADIFSLARIRKAHVAIGLASTADICRHGQEAHRLLATSAIALGRLMTAAALAGQVTRQASALSLQIVCEGRLRQIYADITEKGQVRGYVRDPNFDLPVLPGELSSGR